MRSYLLVLLLPVAIAALGFAIASQAYTKDIRSNTDALQEQYTTQMDQQLELSVRFANMISNHNIVDHLTKRQPFDRYQSFVAQRDLRISTIMGDFTEEFYLCFFQNGVFLNDVTTSNLQMGYERYHRDSMTYDEWLALMRGVHKGEWMPMTYWKGNQLLHSFAYLQSLPIVAASPTSTLVLFFSPDHITRHMDALGASENIIFEILHEDGVVLFSTDGRRDADESLLQEANTARVVQRNGQQMLLSAKRAETLPLVYLIWMPYELVGSSVFRVAVWFSISLIITALAGIYLAIRMTRNSYAPLQQLVEATAATGFEGETVNEYEYLHAATQRSRLMYEALQLQQETLAEHTLTQTLVHRRDDYRPLWHDNGISLDGDVFLVAMLIVEDFTPDMEGALAMGQGQKALRAFAQRQLRDMLPQWQIASTEVGGMMTFLLCGGARAEVLEAFHRMMAEVERQTTVVLTASLSDAVDNPHDGYTQAMVTMEYRLIEGRGTVLDAREIEQNRSMAFRGVDWNRNAMMGAIRDGDSKDALHNMNAYFRLIQRHKGITIHHIRYLLYDFAVVVLNAQQSVASGEDEWLAAHDPIACIHEKDTVEAIKLCMAKIIEGTCEKARDQKETINTTELLDRIVAYIEENLTEADLSVSGIADHFHISLGYLSRYFKKQKQTGLLEYLHRERLKRAKALMQENPEQTLDEIAAQCGLPGSMALIRLFKRYEGRTPGSMRRDTSAAASDPEEYTTYSMEDKYTKHKNQ